jgi:hypothetical protein
VSIRGSSYARFRRALETENLTLVRAAAAELPTINLDDALRVCLLPEEPTAPDIGLTGTIRLKINGNIVDAQPTRLAEEFPWAYLYYVFSVAGEYTASWSVDDLAEAVTWHVSCSLAPPGSPPPTPTSKKQCKHGGWKHSAPCSKTRATG